LVRSSSELYTKIYNIISNTFLGFACVSFTLTHTRHLLEIKRIVLHRITTYKTEVCEQFPFDTSAVEITSGFHGVHSIRLFKAFTEWRYKFCRYKDITNQYNVIIIIVTTPIYTGIILYINPTIRQTYIILLSWFMVGR